MIQPPRGRIVSLANAATKDKKSVSVPPSLYVVKLVEKNSEYPFPIREGIPTMKTNKPTSHAALFRLTFNSSTTYEIGTSSRETVEVRAAKTE